MASPAVQATNTSEESVNAVTSHTVALPASKTWIEIANPLISTWTEVSEPSDIWTEIPNPLSTT